MASDVDGDETMPIRLGLSSTTTWVTEAPSGQHNAMPLMYFLQFDQVVAWKGFLTDAIGPFDTLQSAWQWFQDHYGWLDDVGIEDVTIEPLVTP
jgi:hypothetical protein